MSVRDIEAFLRERATAYDPNIDLTSGSPFDRQVIQPVVRRLGLDPFTVDLTTFITSRLQQAFPELSTEEGDGLTDLLIKPAALLWEPIVREIARVQKSNSFRDPSTLTLDEAEALGANMFAERNRGDFARGVGRVYFAQPQNASVSPINFFTSKSGLIYTPTESQSIRVEEMLLNDNGDGTYYFDVNVIAEKAGSQYNVGPNDLSSIAQLDSAVRVTNLRRFGGGEDEQTSSEFIDEARQQLTERSLVTLRGIAAKVGNSFPEVTRLNSIGFNDPEMQRDVVRGGGLGDILIAGTLGKTTADLIAGLSSRRFTVEDVGVDFTQVIGPVGAVVNSYYLTALDAFIGSTKAADMKVVQVLSANSLEVESSILRAGAVGKPWMVRRRELTLSGIPGGILFPDNPAGTVSIPDDQIHIGGMFDIHVRGSSFDEATLVLDSLADDNPELAGATLTFSGGAGTTSATLSDYELEGNYLNGDEVFTLLARAATDSLSLQVIDGVNAGVYRILSVVQSTLQSPVVSVAPAFSTGVAAPARWKIFDAIDVNLTDIKDTKVDGNDLLTTQNSDIIKTASGTDFDALGVAKGYVLRILSGLDQGDYGIVEDPIVPGFLRLRLDTKLKASASSVQYTIFRPNTAGNLVLPLVRITSVELMDSSSQPLGTKVPYAKPIDIQSRSFQNPARGIKYTLTGVTLGLLSMGTTTTFAVGELTLTLRVGKDNDAILGDEVDVPITFTAGPKTPAQVALAINIQVLAIVGEADVAYVITYAGRSYVGIRPFGPSGFIQTLPTSSASAALFGDDTPRTTNDIRQYASDGLAQVNHNTWAALYPNVDYNSGLDVFQVTAGAQMGPIHGPYYGPTPGASYEIAGQFQSVRSGSVVPKARNHPFVPELGVTMVVGARSIGSARLYFLEPTSFEARANEAFFSLQTANGELRYTPDPTLSYQRIPALPSGSKPLDGQLFNQYLTSHSQDFVRSGVLPGDLVVVDFEPIFGEMELTADPVLNLAHKTFIFSLGEASNKKTLTFIRDDVTIPTTAVTREGVVDQINAAAGMVIAHLLPTNYIEFETEVELIIYKTGTANPLILGAAFTTADFDNISPAAGTFPIKTIVMGAPYLLEMMDTVFPPAGIVRQQFKIMRAGVQRVSTGEMGLNKAEASLFYADIELVSEGVGDVYNIDANQQMKVMGERSDGYYLTTEDSNLTFSPVERPHLVISKTILEQGVDDDPINATQLVGQNLQITYDRTSLVDGVNSFALSETERVVCSNPLTRHLLPHFVRFEATYAGGSSEEVVIPALQELISNVSPVDALESSDIQGTLKDHGATSIENPINLLAVVHNVDRTVTATRSQNRLTTGRLAAFIPDVLNVVRRVNGLS